MEKSMKKKQGSKSEDKKFAGRRGDVPGHESKRNARCSIKENEECPPCKSRHFHQGGKEGIRMGKGQISSRPEGTAPLCPCPSPLGKGVAELLQMPGGVQSLFLQEKRVEAVEGVTVAENKEECGKPHKEQGR